MHLATCRSLNIPTDSADEAYFTLGQVSPAYEALDRHATRRLRQWLCRKHKVRAGKVVRFPADRLWSEYGLTHLAPRTASFPWAKA